MQRRQFLQYGAWGLAAVAAPFAGAAGNWSTDFLRRYRQVRFALHDRVFFWWMRGTKYGVIDAQATPLYAMEIGSIFRCTTTADGGFTVQSLELFYNTDLETGEPLRRWRNPYTEETIDVRATEPVGPVSVPYGAGGPQLPTTLPGATLRHQHHSEFLDGDAGTMLLRDESVSVVSATGAVAPDFHVADLSTYQVARRDLANPHQRWGPASVSFNAMSSWQRWMKMQDRPGSLLSRGVGRKVARMDDMPASYLRLLERLHPDIRRDPAAALEREAARFER
jgi:hypothetical protein